MYLFPQMSMKKILATSKNWSYDKLDYVQLCTEFLLDIKIQWKQVFALKQLPTNTLENKELEGLYLKRFASKKIYLAKIGPIMHINIPFDNTKKFPLEHLYAFSHF